MARHADSGDGDPKSLPPWKPRSQDKSLRRRLSTSLSDSTTSFMFWTPLACLPSGLTFFLGLMCGGAISN